MPFSHLETPCLILDLDKLDHNMTHMNQHLDRLGGTLRPHLKTLKSWELAKHVLGSLDRPIAVSTLKEADYFSEHGAKDILYAVGIAPNKFQHVFELHRKGVDLSVILDSLVIANLLADAAAEAKIHIPVFIEIDTDGHRSGVEPESDVLLDIGRILHDAEYLELRGVLSHAGSSYNCSTPECLAQVAEQERHRTVICAERLKGQGWPCPVVSIGSTPTVLGSKSFESVTEVRAGVFLSFDLVMAGVGVCSVDDISITVLATVTGHQVERGWAIIDAGWMALSRDRGTSSQSLDHGYGLIQDVDGNTISDVIVSGTNQEHGILTGYDKKPLDINRFPIGSQVRVLPNHACATAAQHDRYYVAKGNTIVAEWSRINGW